VQSSHVEVGWHGCAVCLPANLAYDTSVCTCRMDAVPNVSPTAQATIPSSTLPGEHHWPGPIRDFEKCVFSRCSTLTCLIGHTTSVYNLQGYPFQATGKRTARTLRNAVFAWRTLKTMLRCIRFHVVIIFTVTAYSSGFKGTISALCANRF
jgi:hypothetical protein